MEEEKDAFYVVRKGDIIGIYKSFSDCQAQAASSVCSPAVSVFKGYGLTKETEEYLVSNGLSNAAYSISSVHVENDLFGKLIPCPVQPPACSGRKSLEKESPQKRSQGIHFSGMLEPAYFLGASPLKYLKPDNYFESKDSSSHGGLPRVPSTSIATNSQKHFTSDNIGRKAASPLCQSYILEFDGASKGNPGPAGAGAVLRREDGSMVCRLREGLGVATNNAAEYRAVILGLKHALQKGFKHISVQGDSNLVCMQIQGLWKIKNQNIASLCQEAKELKDKFTSFEIQHVRREFNAEADAQANMAINLRAGQVEVEDCS